MSDKIQLHIALITGEDAESLHKLIVANKAYFNRYLPVTVASNLTLEDSRAFIQKISADMEIKKQFLYTIKNADQVIGLVYLKNLDWNLKQGELAYCLAQTQIGKGFMSRSVKQVIDIAFEKLCLEKLVIITHRTNYSSLKMAANCGFVHTATLVKKFTPPGEKPMDMELYELKK